VASPNPLAPPVTIAAHPSKFIGLPPKKVRKNIFFEKKKQKTFVSVAWR
jgi:hypothetical protein